MFHWTQRSRDHLLRGVRDASDTALEAQPFSSGAGCVERADYTQGTWKRGGFFASGRGKREAVLGSLKQYEDPASSVRHGRMQVEWGDSAG